MSFFISGYKITECAVIAVFFAFAMLLSSAKLLGILQSCSYSGARLIVWARKKGNLTFGRHFLLALCCALSSAVIALAFSFAGEWAAVVSLCAYVIFFVVFIFADTRLSLRSPATLTLRFFRLMVAVWLVNLVIAYFFATLLNYIQSIWQNALFADLKYVALSLIPLCMIPIVCLANLIMKVYESPRNASYVRRAKRKLAEAQHLTVVGITGSYGKTSTKVILSAMLSKKYRVLSTPRSHNTPLGISKTVNEADLSEYDVFVAEMGARHVGDIAGLCKICPPDYSIITGVCPQHLESFLTMENIIKGKGEILAATSKKAVIAPDCSQYFKDYTCCTIISDCAASDIKPDCEGTTFTLTLGENSAEVRTKLLGAHAARNIALCARCAYEMGVSFADICDAIGELDYIEHRLQLIKSNGVNILDDGYNANIKGAEAALEVLKTFGGDKTVVTPGLVELGVLDREENSALGAKLVGFDNIVLVGDTLVGYVKSGYLAAGGDEQKVTVVPTLFAAEEYIKGLVKKGDAVLFLNDLPDIYT